MPRPNAKAHLAAALAMASSLALSGCALLPANWWPETTPLVVNGVSFATNDITFAASVTPIVAPAPELSSLNVMPLRIRNDATHVSARFDYVPGANSFNTWLNQYIWNEVRSTGIAYKPQAQSSGSGFGDRGCVPGSSTWAAVDVLTKPATGPSGGSGIAIVCDITGAFGNQLEMTIRTVSGSASSVQRDETTVKIINPRTDEMYDPSQRWDQSSLSTFWGSAVELLKRQAGAESTTHFELPTAEQLVLAKHALENARLTSTGALFVALPAGITSPGLTELGVASTREETLVTIEPHAVRSWSAPAFYAVGEDRAKTFIASEKPLSEVAIDCALVPCVALTYDDGPTTYSPQLLDTLKAQHANATFFMIGQNVTKYPDLVRRTSVEGHELGSHTYDHKDLTKLSAAEARTQVISAADAITKITGKPVTLFRAPYGSINQAAINTIALPAINWNVDPGDWTTPGKTALLSRTIPVAKADSIILMHEIRLDSIQVAKDMIVGLRDRGLEPVTISQLFGGNIPLENVRVIKRS